MSDQCVVRTYLEQDAIIHTSSDREVCQEYLEYTNTWHPIDVRLWTVNLNKIVTRQYFRFHSVE